MQFKVGIKKNRFHIVLIEVFYGGLKLSKSEIKIIVNYPEDEEEMKIFEELQVSKFFEILKYMTDKDGTTILVNALKNVDVV